MIIYQQGNLFDAEVEALVNTVNTVGVMGKGIALQFKKKFPNNYKIYRAACKNKELTTGQVLVVKEGNLLNKKYIINFPTKTHWRSPSKYEYITSGLKALKEAIQEHQIKSIAIPPLGCGNGGLEWEKVKIMIEESLRDLECDIQVYTPNEAIKTLLQKEKISKSVKLTAVRAMLLYLMFRYESIGEQSSLFVSNKLAWFLQRSGEPLRLNFKAHHYGPYAVQLNHVLYNMNGVYLKGMEQNTAKPFDTLLLNYDKYDEVQKYIQRNLSVLQKQRLEDVMELLRGFESTFSIELLASIDYLLQEEKNQSLEKIIQKLSSWNNRKSNLFQDHHIKVAYEHLKAHGEHLAFV